MSLELVLLDSPLLWGCYIHFVVSGFISEMPGSQQSVCVIGAGVIGLSTALRLLQTTSHVTVTVMADCYTPYTTGDGAAGWWEPYMLGDTPKDKIK